VIELIDGVLDILRQNRSNCENFFHKICDQAKNECEKYDAPLLIPRRCKSHIFRDNYPSDDPEHFFREAIFVSYLDHLIVEMKDRFFDQKQKSRSFGLDTYVLRYFAKHCSRFRKVTGNISGRHWSQSSGCS